MIYFLGWLTALFFGSWILLAVLGALIGPVWVAIEETEYTIPRPVSRVLWVTFVAFAIWCLA